MGETRGSDKRSVVLVAEHAGRGRCPGGGRGGSGCPGLGQVPAGPPALALGPGHRQPARTEQAGGGPGPARRCGPERNPPCPGRAGVYNMGAAAGGTCREPGQSGHSGYAAARLPLPWAGRMGGALCHGRMRPRRPAIGGAGRRAPRRCFCPGRRVEPCCSRTRSGAPGWRPFPFPWRSGPRSGCGRLAICNVAGPAGVCLRRHHGGAGAVLYQAGLSHPGGLLAATVVAVMLTVAGARWAEVFRHCLQRVGGSLWPALRATWRAVSPSAGLALVAAGLR